jgi:hypothetical protein
VAAYILDRVNETAVGTYRDGSLFGLASYALTGGPDKSVLRPPTPTTRRSKRQWTP